MILGNTRSVEGSRPRLGVTGIFGGLPASRRGDGGAASLVVLWAEASRLRAETSSLRAAPSYVNGRSWLWKRYAVLGGGGGGGALLGIGIAGGGLCLVVRSPLSAASNLAISCLKHPRCTGIGVFLATAWSSAIPIACASPFAQATSSAGSFALSRAFVDRISATAS